MDKRQHSFFWPVEGIVIVSLLLFISPLSTSAQGEPLVYRGGFRLPLELHTSQGQTLEKGKYDLEVRLEQKAWLRFSRGEQEGVRVEGSELKAAEQEQPTMIPIVGTIFLQSSAVPVRSDAERRYSRTGRPQYVEESYDWRGTLRVHRPLSSQKREVYFIFHEQGQGERHRRIQFTLFRMMNEE